MKRTGNLYQHICSIENLWLADNKARKGKQKQYGVQKHDKNREANLFHLQSLLKSRTYETSTYSVFPVYEPKERLVYRLPYFPDRIAQHAVMNVLEPIFIASLTTDTYSCIKGRGLHAAVKKIKKALRDVTGTRYCLKLDITKFYPSVDHDILQEQLRKKFKDADLLWLLDEMIDSAPGLPIGNYLSQYLANYYLSGFDHWIKQKKGVRYYFRYADDIVIFAPDKESLHALRKDIQEYLQVNLKLQVKSNYQVFPIDDRGLDFLGYVFFHKCTYLRKSIKQRFARSIWHGTGFQTISAYWGWVKHCNGRNLMRKLVPERYEEIYKQAA